MAYPVCPCCRGPLYTVEHDLWGFQCIRPTCKAVFDVKYFLDRGQYFGPNGADFPRPNLGLVQLKPRHFPCRDPETSISFSLAVDPIDGEVISMELLRENWLAKVMGWL